MTDSHHWLPQPLHDPPHLWDQFADAPISRAGGALNSSARSMPPSSLMRKKPAGTAMVLQEMRAICAGCSNLEELQSGTMV